jgi:hypothetical protein
LERRKRQGFSYEGFGIGKLKAGISSRFKGENRKLRSITGAQSTGIYTIMRSGVFIPSKK